MDDNKKVEQQTPAEEIASTPDEGNTKQERGEKKKQKKAEEQIKELTEGIEKLQISLSEAEDKYMRMYAEYDNFRRRTQKEKESIYSDAYVDALTQILPILDNLERAAQFSPEESDSPLAKGLELTLKSMYETLDKMGVKEIEAMGKPFDPNVHNAIMHVDDENLGENEVVEVFVKGYTKGDKILRYSVVKVAN